VNLSSEPTTTSGPAGGEGPNAQKLGFRMDIIALVKPNS